VQLEPSVDRPQTAGRAIQPFQTPVEDIFIWSLGPKCSVNPPLEILLHTKLCDLLNYAAASDDSSQPSDDGPHQNQTVAEPTSLPPAVPENSTKASQQQSEHIPQQPIAATPHPPPVVSHWGEEA